MAEVGSRTVPVTFAAAVRAARPRQWVKNLFIFAALLFTPAALNPANLRQAVLAFVAFCLVSSGVYLCNDILDRHTDRLHPEKRFRAIASGALPVATARLMCGLLLAAGLVLATFLSPNFAWIVGIYVAMNLVYSISFKQVSIVDIMVIAIGFVMRVAGGAVVIGLTPSPWLLECAGLVALFLAIAKRRDDLVLKLSASHRQSLNGYNRLFLDVAMAMILGCLLAIYITYTASNEIIERLGTEKLYYTVPFVVAGILRYLQITIVEHRSGSPTEVVTRDRFLVVTILGWVAVVVTVVYGPL